MFTIVLWFIGIIMTVPILFLFHSYICGMQPGQNRTYLLQPIYRMVVLFGKRNPSERFVARWFSVGALWFCLTTLYFTVTGENLLFILSGLLLVELFLLIGAGSTKERFGSMAAQRGVARLIIWYFAVMVVVASIYQVTGTLNLKLISSFDAGNPLLFKLPLAFASMVVILLMKGSLCHFDFGISGKGLSFLDSGMHTPYSGWSLAVILMTQWVEMGIWLKLASVFLPFATWLSFAIMAILFFLAMLLDGHVAKSSWKVVSRNGWVWAAGMAILNYAWLYLV